MKRTMFYYWQMNLALLLGAAVVAAVLTGALLVGDSVRGSLAELVLDRLGNIDEVVVSGHLFSEDLVEELLADSLFHQKFDGMAPVLFLNGSAAHGASGRRASGLQLYGIDARFDSMYDEAPSLSPLLSAPSGGRFPPVVINQALAGELAADVGDQVLLYFEQHADIHRESVFGRKQTQDIIRSLRLTVQAILPQQGAGHLSLQPGQQEPLNAYISAEELRKRLELGGDFNMLLVSRRQSTADHEEDGQLPLLVKKHLSAADIALNQSQVGTMAVIESAEFILDSLVAARISSAALAGEGVVLPVYTYLANQFSYREKRTPYSTITAIPFPLPASIPQLVDMQGKPVSALSPNEILLNEWLTEDLGYPKAGETISVTYFSVGQGDQLIETEASLKMAGTVKLDGLARDQRLSPFFPGMHNVDNIRDWDPPFPIDLGRIRPGDEAYWDEYHATPKAFVSLETGQALWKSRFGNLSSLRLIAPAGVDPVRFGESVLAEALGNLNLEAAGYQVVPVKARGLAASSGATNFGQLFVGFSQFLIISSLLIGALLFRLAIEQRSPEIGLLLASGYPVKKIIRRFLHEGWIIAAAGCAIGLAGAICYAWLMMAALRTIWQTATGTAQLSLYIEGGTLVTGWLLSVIAMMLTIWLAVRKLRKVPTPRLMAGEISTERQSRGKIARIVAVAGAAGATGLAAAGIFNGPQSATGLFFGAGLLLLIGLTGTAAVWLRSRGSGNLKGILHLSVLNAGRKPGRSLLAIALVACATFMTSVVGSYQRHFDDETLGRTSGAGGYALAGESDVPIYQDLNSPDGRFELGIGGDEHAFDSVAVYQFRKLPGEDASCLNLYQPERPKVIGVGENFIARGGFVFQEQTVSAAKNPWQLLNIPLSDGAIPAIADFNSAMWILHKKLGDDIVLSGEDGAEIRLRLIGLLNKSIFQSELLISDAAFRKAFPGMGGYSSFLVDATPGRVEGIRELLEEGLRDYGLDLSGTAERLTRYQAVENTYMSVFLFLGGLGLVLGTIGLGIILARNTIERRGDLAALRAFGYRKRDISRMLLIEHVMLVLIGLLIGFVSAVMAAAPNLIAEGGNVSWLTLAGLLMLVLITGIVASLASAKTALRAALIPALKGN